MSWPLVKSKSLNPALLDLKKDHKRSECPGVAAGTDASNLSLIQEKCQADLAQEGALGNSAEWCGSAEVPEPGIITGHGRASSVGAKDITEASAAAQHTEE